jgi:chaperonin cofactor prefoldin
MSEDVKPSDMLRQTAGNLGALFEQIAVHIDTLESDVAKLRARIEELESTVK